MNKITSGQYQKVIDIKIELEKVKEIELQTTPKFKDKEVMLNRMFEKLIVATAERVADQCQSTYSFELKYFDIYF